MTVQPRIDQLAEMAKKSGCTVWLCPLCGLLLVPETSEPMAWTERHRLSHRSRSA